MQIILFDFFNVKKVALFTMFDSIALLWVVEFWSDDAFSKAIVHICNTDGCANKFFFKKVVIKCLYLNLTLMSYKEWSFKMKHRWEMDSFTLMVTTAYTYWHHFQDPKSPNIHPQIVFTHNMSTCMPKSPTNPHVSCLIFYTNTNERGCFLRTLSFKGSGL